VHEIENLCYRVKLERAITLQKRNLLSAKSEDLLQANRQSLTLNNRLIDPERTIGRKLDDDRFRTGHRIRTCGLLRQVRLEPHLVARDGHEDDHRSTSRISINGTTFTSDKIPRLPPREAKAMSHLAVKQ
jgi:hypothetical protein